MLPCLLGHAALCCVRSFATLSSLREISVTDTAAEDARLRVPLEVEPKLLALGPSHIMAAINDRAWFYRLRVTADGTAGPPVTKREYLSEVREAALGPTHCVVLCGGTVLAHAIEPSSGGDAAADTPHPLNEGDSPATCVTAVGELVLWGTEDGSVHFWHSPVRQGSLAWLLSAHEHEAPRL